MQDAAAARRDRAGGAISLRSGGGMVCAGCGIVIGEHEKAVLLSDAQDTVSIGWFPHRSPVITGRLVDAFAAADVQGWVPIDVRRLCEDRPR